MDSSDLRWWDKPKKEAADMIVGLGEEVRQQQAYRRTMNLHHLRLYHDKQIQNLLPMTGQTMGGDYVNRRRRLSINVVRNITNALVAHLAKNKIRTVYQTNNGTWEDRYKAYMRTQFVERLMRRENAYATGIRIARDACIFGTGIARIFPEHGRPRVERTFPGEVYVDDEEGVYGDPRKLWHVRTVDKQVAKRLWPGFTKEIEDAGPPDHRYHGRGAISDRLMVYEAYHLPSEPGADDGRYAVAFQGGCPVFRPWRHSSFPYVRFNYSEPPLGWWGTGVADELTGIQFEINQISEAIQAQMYMGGGLKILVEKGSKVTRAHLNNDIRGTVVEYVGQPPRWIAPDSVSPQQLQQLQWLVDQAYAITGMSQLAARSELPAGLSSGRAQLVYKSFQSRRLLDTEERYNQMYVDIAERLLECAADLVESGESVQLPALPGDDADMIDFEDIAMDADDYDVIPYQESSLPEEPAGRFQMVEEFRKAGYIDMQQAKRMQKNRDISGEIDLDLSPAELIDKRIWKMLKPPTGDYLPPSPYMDLQLALRRSTLAVQKAELDGVPDVLIDNVRRFHDEVVALIAKESAPAPAPPGPEMAPGMPGLEAPPAGPGLPPTPGGAPPPVGPPGGALPIEGGPPA